MEDKGLIQFLKKEFPTLVKPNNQSDPLLSKKSTQFILSLYRLIHKAQESFHKNIDKITHTPLSKITDPNYSKGSAYSYIPPEVRTIIERSNKLQKTYEFRIRKDVYRINMVLPIQEKQALSKMQHSKYERFCNESLYKIYLWLFVSDHFAPHECSPIMTINLFFTDHLKMIAKTKMQPLGEIHANTAFTTSCSTETEINLFRSEEWFKVLIHETFHNLGMDFSEMDCSEADRAILQLFPIQKSEVRLFETYCEMWAEIINVIFVVFFSTKSSQDDQNIINQIIIKKIETMLKIESAWSVFQCGKILDHYGLTYQQLTDSESVVAKYKRKSQYKEETYILSYYVIKSVFMTHVDDFIEWCIRPKKTVAFQKTPERIREYCGLVKQLYRSSTYLSRIQLVQDWYRTKHLHTDSYPFVLHTMRMTILG